MQSWTACWRWESKESREYEVGTDAMDEIGIHLHGILFS